MLLEDGDIFLLQLNTLRNEVVDEGLRLQRLKCRPRDSWFTSASRIRAGWRLGVLTGRPRFHGGVEFRIILELEEEEWQYLGLLKADELIHCVRVSLEIHQR